MHLTEDEALLVETVTKLVSDEVKPFARGWETTGIPKELWTTLGELGLLAITTPESKGGAGLGLRDLGLVVGYLAQGDLGLAWALARHNQALAILAETPFQNIEPYLTGQLQIDWSRTSTINASQGCDSLLVLEDEQVVLRHCSRVASPQRFIGGRSLGHAELDPEKSDEALGSYEDTEGLESQGALLAACMAWGLGRSALDAATTYALDREQFGRPIAQFQAIQWKLADGALLLEAAELLIDDGLSHPTTSRSAMAFKASLDALTKLVDDGLQTHGGYGYTEDFDIEKYYRDAQFLAGRMGTRRGQSLKLAQTILNQVS